MPYPITRLLPALLFSTALLASAGAQVSSPDGMPMRRRPTGPPPNPLRNTQPAVTDDWLTFAHDQQRTGWDNGDKTLTAANVPNLALLWSAQLPVTPSPYAAQTLTTPLVVSGVKTHKGTRTVVYTLSGDDILMAVDAGSGKLIWKKSFKNPDTPAQAPNWMCTNTEQATPVIDKDKGVLYFTTSDGMLRGASLGDGKPQLAPVQVLPPYARNWSLNLVGDEIYTTAARGCGGESADSLPAGVVVAANVADPKHVTANHLYTGFGRPAGPWNRGGTVLGPLGMYFTTADGRYDPAAGFFGESVLAIRAGDRGVADSFTPANWRYLNVHDLDMGAAGPLIFPFHGQAILATGSKESVEYLLDANELGGFDHKTPLYASPQLGNDPVKLGAYGIWGGGATWANPSGDRYLYLPMWNAPSKKAPEFPHSNGDFSQGSIMAFRVIEKDRKPALEPAWISGMLQAPDMPAVADGVVFAVSTGEQTEQFSRQTPPGNLNRAKFRNTPVGHQVLYAFDAETGAQLYSSQDLLKDWGHFSQPVISNGEVFVVSHDGHLYAFGLKKQP
jgi:outer membrane protein assembly factor BamB